jgi:hypothetical protein
MRDMHFKIILGSERSGTNIFQRALCEESGLGGPRPIHLLNTVRRARFPGKSCLSDLGLHVYNLVNCEFSQWGLSLDACRRVCMASESWADLFVRLHLEWCLSNGFNGAVIKDNELQSYVKSIGQACDSLGVSVDFRGIVRDPLDVVTSWMKTPIWHTQVYNPATHWLRLNAQMIELGVDVVRYEDLSPQLGESGASGFQCRGGDSPLWENTSRPFISGNSNKFGFLRVADQVCVYALTRSVRSRYYDPIPWMERLSFVGMAQLCRWAFFIDSSYYVRKFSGDLGQARSSVNGGRQPVHQKLLKFLEDSLRPAADVSQ